MYRHLLELERGKSQSSCKVEGVEKCSIRIDKIIHSRNYILSIADRLQIIRTGLLCLEVSEWLLQLHGYSIDVQL
jgi:hypothetical protein